MIPLEYWLETLRRRRWTLHLGGSDSRHPDWMAAHLRWPEATDVVIIRDEGDATAFRVPADGAADVLDPSWVTWVYSAGAVWTVRAVLTLPPPGAAGEPVCLMCAPTACRIPLVGRRPVTMRPL